MGDSVPYYDILTVGLLGIYALTDLWKGWIWWPLSLIFMGGTLGLHLVLGDAAWISLAAGVMLGLLLLAAARATREAIGYGDGLAVAACGAALGFFRTFALFGLAICFSAVWSVALVVFRKFGKKDSFPFMPFLLAAQVCIMFGAG